MFDYKKNTFLSICNNVKKGKKEEMSTYRSYVEDGLVDVIPDILHEILKNQNNVKYKHKKKSYIIFTIHTFASLVISERSLD